MPLVFYATTCKVLNAMAMPGADPKSHAVLLSILHGRWRPNRAAPRTVHNEFAVRKQFIQRSVDAVPAELRTDVYYFEVLQWLCRQGHCLASASDGDSAYTLTPSGRSLLYGSDDSMVQPLFGHRLQLYRSTLRARDSHRLQVLAAAAANSASSSAHPVSSHSAGMFGGGATLSDAAPAQRNVRPRYTAQSSHSSGMYGGPGL